MNESEETLVVRAFLSRANFYAKEAQRRGERILSRRDRERIEESIEELGKIRARLVIEDDPVHRYG